MIRKLIIAVVMTVFATAAEAGSIKVLILDDVFQKVPSRDEKIEKMGKLNGDLLVNGSHYVGNIEVWKGREGLYLINELPLEDYIKNVVSSEVGTTWEMEALKAQAVISRTYALYQKSKNVYTNFDLTSSVLHQVYKGAAVDPRISYSVSNTEGEVLMYNGQLIEAFYHSTCGGMTENAEEVFGKGFPYLRSVETSCELSPYGMWERRIPTEEFEKAFKISGVKEVIVTSYTSTGRVKSVDIIHSSGKLSVKGNDLRKALGWSRLPSTNFSVTCDNAAITFEGKGYGHGVGLCQWSALQMAKEGKNYKEIIAHFYPGTIIKIYEDR